MAANTGFRIGDLVRITGGRAPAPGIHEVVELLPAPGRERLYRVRAGSGARERTVEERALRRA